MKVCISEASTLPASFAEDVAAYADAGCPAMEVWLTKLETHLETHSAADTQKLLADRGVILAAAAYQGGLLLSQGGARKSHFDHYRRRPTWRSCRCATWPGCPARWRPTPTASCRATAT